MTMVFVVVFGKIRFMIFFAKRCFMRGIPVVSNAFQTIHTKIANSLSIVLIAFDETEMR